MIEYVEEILPLGNARKDVMDIDDVKVPRYTDEFWTSKQRQASSIHEISYRACFKPQLPRFFISSLTSSEDTVYDPFAGRGTTPLEAALLGRNVISNDINPLAEIMLRPRLSPPDIGSVRERLRRLDLSGSSRPDIDLSMFYHRDTLNDLSGLRDYLLSRRENRSEDNADRWIRMVATNRLSGHSPGFFSVYTLPPNQATTPERQISINEKRNQVPPFRDIKKLILKKSVSLMRNVTEKQLIDLRRARAMYLTADASMTDEIDDGSVDLTVTSPPFLDVVQYENDNWLRFWFNDISMKEGITIERSIDGWSFFMNKVFDELYRITSAGGFVAFEVGEIRGGKEKLDEVVAPIGVRAGFRLRAVLLNSQTFTKTSNIWGVDNNRRGTNTNRIVLFSRSSG
jgi:DNA modification methylase